MEQLPTSNNMTKRKIKLQNDVVSNPELNSVGLVRGCPRTDFLMKVPNGIFEYARQAAIQETGIRGFHMPMNEFILRATIDRIGFVLGARHAERLYKAYFNGIGYLGEPVEIFKKFDPRMPQPRIRNTPLE